MGNFMFFIIEVVKLVFIFPFKSNESSIFLLNDVITLIESILVLFRLQITCNRNTVYQNTKYKTSNLSPASTSQTLLCIVQLGI